MALPTKAQPSAAAKKAAATRKENEAKSSGNELKKLPPAPRSDSPRLRRKPAATRPRRRGNRLALRAPSVMWGRGAMEERRAGAPTPPDRDLRAEAR